MRQVIQGLEEGLSAIAEALEGGGGSSIVPTPTAADEGKVLTAGDDGTASWEDAQGGLPDPGQASQGSVLALGYSREPEWETNITDLLPNGSAALVPATAGVTNGYVLTNNNGTPAWAAASGGGGGGTTIYAFDSAVWDDDKSGNYYISVNSSTIANDSVAVLAVYNTDGHYPTVITTPYSYDAGEGYIQISFGTTNPNFTSARVVYAATTTPAN